MAGNNGEISELARHLHDFRKRTGLSLERVAKGMGLSGHAHLSHIEQGMSEPGVLYLLRLAKVYQCHVRELIPEGWDGEKG